MPARRHVPNEIQNRDRDDVVRVKLDRLCRTPPGLHVLARQAVGHR